MDYFDVEGMKEDIRIEMYGSVGVSVVILLIINIVRVFIYRYVYEVGKGVISNEFLGNTIWLVLNIVMFVYIVKIFLEFSLYEEVVDYEEYGMNRVNRLERRKKLNNVVRCFGKSENYKKYVESMGLDSNKFVKEMVEYRNYVEKRKEDIEDNWGEEFFEMYASIIVDPSRYEDNIRYVKRVIEYLERKDRYEELKEEVKKEEYLLGEEGAKLRKKIEEEGFFLKYERYEICIPILKDFNLEKVNYFIEKVNEK